MSTHDELRQINRKSRAAIAPQQQSNAAQQLFEKVIVQSEFISAKRIAAYSAVNGEISLEPVIEYALQQGKEIFLPNLDLESLRFSPYFTGQRMRINRFKLPEPDVQDNEMLQPAELDLVLAPLVVFDHACNRIGMGGGYYDRSFEFRRTTSAIKPILIGVAHELQKVENLTPQPWDVRLDKIISDETIYVSA